MWSPSNGMGSDATATPCEKTLPNSSQIEKAVIIAEGVNQYSELRTIQAIHLNMKMSCSLLQQTVHVATTNTVRSSKDLNKQVHVQNPQSSQQISREWKINMD
jgi:hypothetical protein